MFKKLIPIITIAVLMTSSCSKSGGPTKVSGSPHKISSGLEFWDLKTGTGAQAAAGKHISVHYTGWLTDGTKFDSSVGRNAPYGFLLGAGQVIKRDKGMAGMKVGGKRQLRIPPELGYGTRSVGPIPPNSTLIFDVELLDVQ